jgi:hypothetical protein
MKLEEQLIFEKYMSVVNEGGAAGHMKHPFDLPDVNSFDDLVNVFYGAIEKLDKGTSSVKLDGVNLSLKVVPDENNKTFKRQFALDRGSQKEIDVQGITVATLTDRFPEGHGMLEKGKTILSIMNNSMPEIVNDLKKLGMWNDSTKFINTEYIEGKENVIDYNLLKKDGNAKIIAFHGINQFVEKTNRKGERTRPGLKPRPNIKETSRSINYDSEALQSLREKVKPVAEEYGFDVITNIYAQKKGVPNLENALSSTFTVLKNGGEPETKPIKQWIKELPVLPDLSEKLSMKDGKKRGAVSKDVYMSVLNAQTPLSDLFEEEDIETAIAGALTYHVTRVLGNEILRNYTTDNYGDTDKHEGIVITDVEYGKDDFGNPNSIKITGDFIVDGMGGTFATNRAPASDEEDQSAPAVNYGGGKMDFSSYFSNPRSSKDPGGTGFKGKVVK